ncbi:ergosterol biosynthesis protein-like protein [Melanomma pulvis-pyrius CBS 109.77]|uniref:Ergosterol biosynthesis protein-like protein n=1 Tax=Melanomma pulvis-pyrius CBS 109.77 TaxID=1314802 RepID=A0A6A6XKI3_9PLEO|nr:ergosterol biosynthesis protein-like protein [Melanomma pulvis-pyrius CBS 109.77]
MGSELSSYFPPGDGLLPKWLLLVAVISIGNSIQSYSTLRYTRRIYTPASPPSPSGVPPRTLKSPETPSQVTPLSARTFGTWTLLTSIVRLHAAYNIHDPVIYKLALWTYGVAWLHFMSEWWVYGTTKWGMPLAGPVFVSTGSLLWMGLQWGFYVKG